MKAAEALTKILLDLNSGLIEVASRNCLNGRHKAMDCRRCFDACPVGAGRLGEKIEIDLAKCTGCGLCTHLCPTNVFLPNGNFVEELILQVQRFSKESPDLIFLCSPFRHASAAAFPYPTLELPCLAWLSPTVLLWALANGARRIWLEDHHCPNCPSGSLYPEIQKGVKVAERLLSALGHPQRIFLGREEANFPEGKDSGENLKAVPVKEIPLSRREFFFSYRNRVAKSLSQLMVSAVSTEAKGRERLAQRVPPERRLLQQLLPKLGHPIKEALSLDDFPLAEVKINNTCSACELCTLFCPTGALTQQIKGESVEILFRNPYCVACALCQKVCPEEAILLSDEIPTMHLILPEPNRLMHCQLTACAECGTLCAQRGERSLCFVCRKREGWQRLNNKAICSA